MPDIRYGYMCGTDFDHDMEANSVTIYPTLKMLKEKEPCIGTFCNAIKVEIKMIEMEDVIDERSKG